MLVGLGSLVAPAAQHPQDRELAEQAGSAVHVSSYPHTPQCSRIALELAVELADLGCPAVPAAEPLLYEELNKTRNFAAIAVLAPEAAQVPEQTPVAVLAGAPAVGVAEGRLFVGWRRHLLPVASSGKLLQAQDCWDCLDHWGHLGCWGCWGG